MEEHCYVINECVAKISTAFLSRVSLTSTPQSFFFPNHWLLSCMHKNRRNNRQRYHEERDESCRNDYHQCAESNRPSRESNQQPHVLKSCTLPTAPWGLAPKFKNSMLGTWFIVATSVCIYSNFCT